MIDWEYEAIINLAPNSSWLRNDEGLEWGDNNSEVKPSQEEIDAEIIRLQAEYSATQYQRDRQYPSIGDQLDMQYHDQIDGTTTWKDAIAKVKSDNPKE
jgi:hypothetical protein